MKKNEHKRGKIRTTRQPTVIKKDSGVKMRIVTLTVDGEVEKRRLVRAG